METIMRLEKWFDECPGALVAFSGGVDSSLVAFLAQHFLGRKRVLAVISASPSLKLSDLEGAKEFASSFKLPLRVIQTAEMDNPNYFNNPSNRCYYCKHTLYDTMGELIKEFPDWWILNGTNVDDLGDYRPGLEAAEKFSVRSPLADCQLNKQAVREMAEAMKLPCWDKPASPCLSSRVPYGELITGEKLRQIESAEACLSGLGFEVNRVRHHGETARIEVPVEMVSKLRKVKELISKQLIALGFSQVEFDEEGFVSGKLNRAIFTNE